MPYRPTFDRVFTLELVIAAIVFTLVVTFLTVALVRGRKGAPSRRSEWKRLEWSYVLALIAVAGFIVWLSLSANADEHRTSAPPQLVIHVTAFQWCWRFAYPEGHITVTGSCAGGRNLPTMVVPTNTSVEIDLKSSDVIHEFWVPYLRFKEEAFQLDQFISPKPVVDWPLDRQVLRVLRPLAHGYGLLSPGGDPLAVSALGSRSPRGRPRVSSSTLDLQVVSRGTADVLAPGREPETGSSGGQRVWTTSASAFSRWPPLWSFSASSALWLW